MTWESDFLRRARAQLTSQLAVEPAYPPAPLASVQALGLGASLWELEWTASAPNTEFQLPPGKQLLFLADGSSPALRLDVTFTNGGSYSRLAPGDRLVLDFAGAKVSRSQASSARGKARLLVVDSPFESFADNSRAKPTPALPTPLLGSALGGTLVGGTVACTVDASPYDIGSQKFDVTGWRRLLVLAILDDASSYRFSSVELLPWFELCNAQGERSEEFVAQPDLLVSLFPGHSDVLWTASIFELSPWIGRMCFEPINAAFSSGSTTLLQLAVYGVE